MKNRNRYSRRTFLKASSIVGLTLAWPGSRTLGANSDIRVAILGLGGKGGQHVTLFGKIPDVRVTALCDVDPQRLEKHADELRKKGASPQTATDPRRILESREVDAVVIATPNHWHALLTLWAIQAGKDVYVEKPVSHNPHEGAQMVAAQRASGRIVQAGTQYRSDRGLQAAAAWLNEGHLGRLLWGHVLWYEHRRSIGKCAPFMPEGLDYGLWCGPSPCESITRPRLHYDWHWVWSTGDGDLGNSGIHAFDACRWFALQGQFPRRVLSLGERFTFDDAGQTPNTQLTLVDYPDAPLLIENRNLPMERGSDVMDTYRRIREGFVLQFEGGYFAGLRAGGVVMGTKGERMKEFVGDGGRDHQANFIEAVRNRRQAALNAPIAEGDVSTSVCHLGNISYRLGREASLSQCKETIARHVHADETFERLARSLEPMGVNLDRTPFTLGPWLNVDSATGKIFGVGDGEGESLQCARDLAQGSYRTPFVLPKIS